MAQMIFDNVNAPRGMENIGGTPYHYAECKHPVREWLENDDIVCLDCGMVVGRVTRSCGECGGKLDIVRPGKYQCPGCG